MRIWQTTALLFLLSLNCAWSQQTDSSYVGAFFSYNFNTYNSSFGKLPGVPNCCPKFTEGQGRGYSVGLYYEYALPLHLSLSLRGGFNNLAGIFTVYEQTSVKVSNQIIVGEFKHYLNTKLSDISLEPILSYRVIGGLSLHIGGHMGFFVQKEYSQYEEITKPDKQGVFVDTETRRRNVYSGTIDSIATVFSGLVAGISYSLPLTRSGSLLLVPEIFYLYGRSDIIEKYNWKADALKFGISLKYTNTNPQRRDEYNKTYKLDTVRVNTVLADIAGYHPGRALTNYTTEETDDLVIHNTIITRTDTIYVLQAPRDTVVPKAKPDLKVLTDKEVLTLRQDYATFYCSILPSVFFNLNSSSIQAGYNTASSIGSYTPRYEPDDPLTIQKDILNIIGSRLKDNPTMRITLKGYIDRTTEGQNCSLAVERAESIKKYLVNTWSIAADRIYVIDKSFNCNPRIRTATQNDMGYADNRRVEILSDNMQIYAPVIVSTPVDSRNADDETLTVTPRYNMPDSVAEWQVSVKNGSKVIYTDKGLKMPSEFTLDINKTGLKNKLSYSEPLSIEFYLKDKDNTVAYGTKNIPLKNESADIETKRIAYILFDVDKKVLNEINESTLKTILNKIGSFRNLKLTGFTDVLGEYQRNKNLSMSRVQTINRIVERLKPESVKIELFNAANDYFPFGIKSYNTQIERFLSRSVVVELY